MKRVLTIILIIISLWAIQSIERIHSSASYQLAGELGDVKPAEGDGPKSRTLSPQIEHA